MTGNRQVNFLVLQILTSINAFISSCHIEACSSCLLLVTVTLSLLASVNSNVNLKSSQWIFSDSAYLTLSHIVVSFIIYLRKDSNTTLVRHPGFLVSA